MSGRSAFPPPGPRPCAGSAEPRPWRVRAAL